jgi:hypothetical protein
VKKLRPSFASGPSFLDPQTSNDGSPYGPKRYKEIARECWYVSDSLHTSYTDVLDLSYAERVYLIEFINAKNDATKKAFEEARSSVQSR